MTAAPVQHLGSVTPVRRVPADSGRAAVRAADLVRYAGRAGLLQAIGSTPDVEQAPVAPRVDEVPAVERTAHLPRVGPDTAGTGPLPTVDPVPAVERTGPLPRVDAASPAGAVEPATDVEPSGVVAPREMPGPVPRTTPLAGPTPDVVRTTEVAAPLFASAPDAGPTGQLPRIESAPDVERTAHVAADDVTCLTGESRSAVRPSPSPRPEVPAGEVVRDSDDVASAETSVRPSPSPRSAAAVSEIVRIADDVAARSAPMAADLSSARPSPFPRPDAGSEAVRISDDVPAGSAPSAADLSSARPSPFPRPDVVRDSYDVGGARTLTDASPPPVEETARQPVVPGPGAGPVAAAPQVRPSPSPRSAAPQTDQDVERPSFLPHRETGGPVPDVDRTGAAPVEAIPDVERTAHVPEVEQTVVQSSVVPAGAAPDLDPAADTGHATEAAEQTVHVPRSEPSPDVERTTRTGADRESGPVVPAPRTESGADLPGEPPSHRMQASGEVDRPSGMSNDAERTAVSGDPHRAAPPQPEPSAATPAATAGPDEPAPTPAATANPGGPARTPAATAGPDGPAHTPTATADRDGPAPAAAGSAVGPTPPPRKPTATKRERTPLGPTGRAALIAAVLVVPLAPLAFGVGGPEDAPPPAASVPLAMPNGTIPIASNATVVAPGQKGPARPVAAPSGLSVPSIGLTAGAPEQLGIDANGQLGAPVDFDRIGFYTQGPKPGEAGPAVIVGHVDSFRGPAVFFRLKDIQPGQQIVVPRTDGRRTVFTVDAVKRYPKDAFPSDEVYGPTANAQLRLITCGGTFDRSVRSYEDNVVVFASVH